MKKFIPDLKKYLILDNNPRTRKAQKNVYMMFALNIFNFIAIYALVPISIDYLGTLEYGIWMTIYSIIMWLIHLDFGIGNGLRNKLSESLTNKDYDKAKTFVSSAYSFFGIGILILISLFLIMHQFIDWQYLFKAPNYLADTITNTVLFVFIIYSVSFLLKLITSIINADQTPAINVLLSVIANTLTLLFVFILARTTNGNLLYIGTVSAGIPLVVFLCASLILFNRQYKLFSPSIFKVNFKYAKELLSLGINFFVIQLSILILYTSDNIIITRLFGPSEVTIYNVSYRLFYFIPLVFNVIVTPFWSATTEAFLKKELDWINNSIKKILKIFLLLSILTLIIVLFSNMIYNIWVGEDINVPFVLSVFMGIFAVLSNWNNLFTSFINGIGKIKLQFYSSIFVSIINIPLSIFLAKTMNMGITGVIAATCACLLITSLWAPIQFQKLIKGKAKGIWNK